MCLLSSRLDLGVYLGHINLTGFLHSLLHVGLVHYDIHNKSKCGIVFYLPYRQLGGLRELGDSIVVKLLFYGLLFQNLSIAFSVTNSWKWMKYRSCVFVCIYVCVYECVRHCRCCFLDLKSICFCFSCGKG